MFTKKTKDAEPIDNLPRLLMVKLFFIEKPILDDHKIKTSLGKRFKHIDFPDLEDREKKSRHYFFTDYTVAFENGEIPAQGTLFVPDTDGIAMEELETSFGQSWNWDAAESVVNQCKHEILLTDMMSRNLDYKQRLEFFQKFTTSIVEVLQPNAIWISNGEKLMDPKAYLECFEAGDYQNLNGLLNVRLYNIQESNGAMLMDTLGLNALGLPDFELRFKGYGPPVIAGLLFNYGSYIYESGSVIEDGNTIQGIETHQKWKCHFRESLIAPQRTVIEIETEG